MEHQPTPPLDQMSSSSLEDKPDDEEDAAIDSLDEEMEEEAEEETKENKQSTKLSPCTELFQFHNGRKGSMSFVCHGCQLQQL